MIHPAFSLVVWLLKKLPFYPIHCNRVLRVLLEFRLEVNTLIIYLTTMNNLVAWNRRFCWLWILLTVAILPNNPSSNFQMGEYTATIGCSYCFIPSLNQLIHEYPWIFYLSLCWYWPYDFILLCMEGVLAGALKARILS